MKKAAWIYLVIAVIIFTFAIPSIKEVGRFGEPFALIIAVPIMIVSGVIALLATLNFVDVIKADKRILNFTGLLISGLFSAMHILMLMYAAIIILGS